jgi:hypothetical protein
MAYRDLTLSEMLSLGDALLTPSAHARLSAEPLLAPLLNKLAQLQAALRAYVASGGCDSTLPDALQSITAQLAALDDTHDRKMRGTFYALRAATEGGDDPATVANAQAALQLIFPDGLSVTDASYQAEGNRAQLIETILDDDTEALLSTLSCGAESAATWLRQAIDAAKQLAALDRERDRLAMTTDAAFAPRSGATALARQWATLIKSLDRLAPLSSLPPDDARALLSPLRDALKATAKRR